MSAAIVVEGVSKRYRIGASKNRHGYQTLREQIGEWMSGLSQRLADRTPSKPTDFWALRDVGFEVQHGEILGVIGRNGTGKSTLLKILSRITKPTAGTVRLRGRVGSLLEVGTGLHPELTGRENIFLSGAILGMSRSEVRRKFDDIVEFAGVEQFLETPVKRYSSGMYVRLGFAVAAHLEPEILLIDEVLAVGDAAFQKKCLGKMGDVAASGRTVLFVSHNMAAVQHLCQRAILLEEGRTVHQGACAEVVSRYLRSASGEPASLEQWTGRRGSGELRVRRIHLRDSSGDLLDVACSGQDIEVCLDYVTTNRVALKNVTVSIRLTTIHGTPVFLHHNRLAGKSFDELPAAGRFVCRIPCLPLPAATYRVTYAVMASTDYIDGVEDAAEMTVVSGRFFESGEIPPVEHGVCLVHGAWRVEPTDEDGTGHAEVVSPDRKPVAA